MLDDDYRNVDYFFEEGNGSFKAVIASWRRIKKERAKVLKPLCNAKGEEICTYCLGNDGVLISKLYAYKCYPECGRKLLPVT